MPDETVGDVRLRDPLSDVTRKERKFLLGISVIAITLVKAGIVPTKLSALGVEFGKTDQQSLLWVLGLITLYFLVAFVVYASSDFLAWRLAFRQAHRRSLKERIEAEERKDPSFEKLQHEVNRSLQNRSLQRMGDRVVFGLSRPVSFTRALFEFILPILIGIYTIILVWTEDLPNISN